MDITEHFAKINTNTQKVFTETLQNKAELGKAHHFSACIYEFTQNIADESERKILETVASQLELATLNVTYGMYRQAYTSLRLALEMGLGAAYFSVHKLEFQEWLDGRTDIRWASLTDKNNGVLSPRFAKAFFPEFSKDINDYLSKAKVAYRQLSEYVHGNNETWEACNIKISYDQKLLDTYFKSISTVYNIILFVLCCRYLKTFSKEANESLDFLAEEMHHLSYIREYLGGPGELK